MVIELTGQLNVCRRIGDERLPLLRRYQRGNFCHGGAVARRGRVANATVQSAPVPSFDDNDVGGQHNSNNDQHSDKTGLWGLLGLLQVNRPATQAGWRVEARNLLVAFEGVFDLLASVFQA